MINFFEIVRIVAGSIYVLFLPGFLLSYVFMKKGEADALERLAVSFALSISVVPLVVYYINMLGVKVSAWSVFFEIAGVIGLTTLALYIIDRKSTRFVETPVVEVQTLKSKLVGESGERSATVRLAEIAAALFALLRFFMRIIRRIIKRKKS